MLSLLLLTFMAANPCPVEIIKVSWYPVVGYRLVNNTAKTVIGYKVKAGYLDSTDDLIELPITWSGQPTVKAGATSRIMSSEPDFLFPTRPNGWIVVPVEVLFDDGTRWQQLFSTHTCYGTWVKKGHIMRQ